MWGFWWTKRHWGRFSQSVSVSLANHSTNVCEKPGLSGSLSRGESKRHCYIVFMWRWVEEQGNNFCFWAELVKFPLREIYMGSRRTILRTRQYSKSFVRNRTFRVNMTSEKKHTSCRWCPRWYHNIKPSAFDLSRVNNDPTIVPEEISR
jgi:hypothetical protein